MAVTDSAAQFDFGRVTSRTFGLVGRNFVPFAVLSLIFAGLPAAVVMSVQPAMMAGAAASQDQTSLLLIIYGAVFVSYLAGLVLSAALTRASVDDLSGKPVAIGSALSTGLALILPMLGLGIVMGVAIVFGLILLIVPGIYLALRWAVAAPALVVERPGIFKAMERSAVLTQNHRWAILGLIVLYAIAAFILQMIVMLAIPGGMVAMSGLSGEAPPIIAIVLLTAVSVVTSMVATVGVAAIYFELRQIKEGVDVTELAKVFA
jgi:hypothetical protein